ncbi:MAG: ABC transporter permease [Anaerolineales bacterium]|nr:ABC transporter permease [Anaerolineales bacterium]
MKNLKAALWVETLKARRSKIFLGSAAGLSLAPIMGGLFMIILKDPEAARSMGLISLKAQLTVGTAEWASMFDMLSQAVAIGGMVVFSMIAAWSFGREFSDQTAKTFLAVPTSRSTIVAAKLVVLSVWSFGLTILVLGLGLLVGFLVDIPGWSVSLLQASIVNIIGASILTILLLPFVALMAGLGRGYLLPMGWTFLMLIFAQVFAVIGWGEIFPWSIPALFSGAAGLRSDMLGPHSYVIISVSSLIGLVLTFRWWNHADHAK